MSNLTKSGLAVELDFLVGSFLAGLISHTGGNPLGWVSIHSFLSWFYIFYRMLGFGGESIW